MIEEMKQHDGCTTLKTRRSLAAAAYAHTAAYDAAISTWFAEQVSPAGCARGDADKDVLGRTRRLLLW